MTPTIILSTNMFINCRVLLLNTSRSWSSSRSLFLAFPKSCLRLSERFPHLRLNWSEYLYIWNRLLEVSARSPLFGDNWKHTYILYLVIVVIVWVKRCWGLQCPLETFPRSGSYSFEVESFFSEWNCPEIVSPDSDLEEAEIGEPAGTVF